MTRRSEGRVRERDRDDCRSRRSSRRAPCRRPGNGGAKYKTSRRPPVVGMVEPLVVWRQRDGNYLLLDGHNRLSRSSMEAGAKEAECIVSTDDEAYTYNAARQSHRAHPGEPDDPEGTGRRGAGERAREGARSVRRRRSG